MAPHSTVGTVSGVSFHPNEQGRAVIDTYLALTDAEKTRLLRWYANQSEPAQLEIHSIKRDLFLRHRESFLGRCLGKDVADQACLIMATRHLKKTLDALERKGTVDSKSLAIIHALRIREFIQKKRSCPRRKAKRLEAYREEIASLRGQGLSWRDISKFLAKHRKVSISHTYLRQQHLQMVRQDPLLLAAGPESSSP